MVEYKTRLILSGGWVMRILPFYDWEVRCRDRYDDVCELSGENYVYDAADV